VVEATFPFFRGLQQTLKHLVDLLILVAVVGKVRPMAQVGRLGCLVALVSN